MIFLYILEDSCFKAAQNKDTGMSYLNISYLQKSNIEKKQKPKNNTHQVSHI